MITTLISSNSSYKNKFKQRWSTIPPISTKWITTSNNWTVKKRQNIIWSWKSRSWIGNRQKYAAGFKKLHVFFFLYCILQYQIHTFKLDCCNHLHPSDVSYFTISLRNHQQIVWLCLWCFACYFWDTRVFDLIPYHISTTSASMLTSSAVVRGIKPLSGQTKDHKIGICRFSVKHAVFRSKSKDWFSQNQVYESKWSDMSTRWLFQWTGTIKI
jgi:hypothetical protein